jgi:hypothetical protein
VAYLLDAEGPVRVAVFDPRGREVALLVDGIRPAGLHEVSWDGRDGAGGESPSGVYFVTLRAGTATLAQKVLLAR